MTERLNNAQIAQLILNANSDLKRYLDLAPGLKMTPLEPKNTCSSKPQITPAPFPRPTIRA